MGFPQQDVLGLYVLQTKCQNSVSFRHDAICSSLSSVKLFRIQLHPMSLFHYVTVVKLMIQ